MTEQRHPSLTWDENAQDYAAVAWFDRHWMHVGPCLAIVALAYVVVVKRYPLGSVSALAWLAPIVYTVHQFEEHAWDIYGRPQAFRWFITNEVGYVWSCRFYTIVNVGVLWGSLGLWILYYERTGDPMLILPAHLVLLSQASHIKWYFNYDMYNPGLIQTIAMNLPVGYYAVRTVWQQYKPTWSNAVVLFPVSLVILLMNVLPMLLVDGDEWKLTVCICIGAVIPVFVARFLSTFLVLRDQRVK